MKEMFKESFAEKVHGKNIFELVTKKIKIIVDEGQQFDVGQTIISI